MSDELWEDDDDTIEYYDDSGHNKPKKETIPEYKIPESTSDSLPWIANKGIRDQQPIEPDNDSQSKWDRFKI
tara:strand:+ start:3882 stop:4097 length:216 start_codon:yes stop_codon:yes gene_type:complete